MELEKIEALVKNGNILNTYIENLDVLREQSVSSLDCMTRTERKSMRVI